MLLAASIPARPGERVLDGGTGSGAALLCLAARVPGVRGVGVERDAAQAAQAAENVTANGWDDRLRIETADLLTWRADAPFDHAMANPPFHDVSGTPSPDPARAAARRAEPGLLAAWIAALARPLRHRGTLTLIVATARVPEVLTALPAARCGSVTLLPIWPNVLISSKLALIRGVRGGHAPFVVRPGLALHFGRTPTAEAVAISRNAAALTL